MFYYGQQIEQRPYYCFKKEEYSGKVFVFQYPLNLIHGIHPGMNVLDKEGNHTISITDFLEPQENDFIKDLVVISLSNENTAEN